MTKPFPTEHLKLESDVRAVTKYLRAVNDPETSPTQVKELMFRIGLRLMRIESDVAAVGRFVDEVSSGIADPAAAR